MPQRLGSIEDARSSGGLATRKRSAIALAVALLCLNVLDLAITRVAVTHLGGVELNPLLAPLLGSGWADLLKIEVPLLIVILATQIRSERVVALLRVAVAVYLVVDLVTLGQVVVALA